MGLIEIVVMLCMSGFLTYQGLCVTGIVTNMPRLSIKYLDTNSIVAWMTGLKVSSFGIALGILGIVAIIGSIAEVKLLKDEDETHSKFTIIALISYLILCILSIL